MNDDDIWSAAHEAELEIAAEFLSMSSRNRRTTNGQRALTTRCGAHIGPPLDDFDKNPTVKRKALETVFTPVDARANAKRVKSYDTSLPYYASRPLNVPCISITVRLSARLEILAPNARETYCARSLTARCNAL